MLQGTREFARSVASIASMLSTMLGWIRNAPRVGQRALLGAPEVSHFRFAAKSIPEGARAFVSLPRFTSSPLPSSRSGEQQHAEGRTTLGVVSQLRASAMMRRQFATENQYGIWENLRTEKRQNGVAVVTLHRPKALNALCGPLMEELVNALGKMDADPEVKAIVLTGSERAFAAGADIKEMKDKNYAQVSNKKQQKATTTKVSILCSRARLCNSLKVGIACADPFSNSFF